MCVFFFFCGGAGRGRRDGGVECISFFISGVGVGVGSRELQLLLALLS